MVDELSAQQRQAIVAEVALKRTGTPRDCAGECRFLASGLSGFVTAATIDVNGGSRTH
jgi:NAD(P)-dependent dehydrogenase (short-subunit alcohol dehydrogenase family)